MLFADLKGSMELLADRDAEEARKILDPVLELMMEAVHRYEGTVNQVMGDGIMALFGAPVAHEDHAVRACYAALRMQDAVKRYAEGVRRAEGIPIQIRVGLNSGEVVVRAIGSDLHMDYTAVGQTTHLAARMEQAALPGSIVITPDTQRLAEGFVEVASLGAMSVKGLAEPLEVYELTRAGAAPTRFQAATARGLTRLVGRTTEVEQLGQALARAEAGHGQVVALVGEAGVGKSRLLHEFSRSERVRGWRVLEAGAVPYGKTTVYLPVIDLLKRYFAIEGRDEPRAVRDKVVGRVLGLDGALEPLLAPLLTLLDAPVEDPGWERLDPSQRRQRTLEAVRRLLLRESQARPLLLVIEDLHWIDGETQAFLDVLVEGLRSLRILVLVNFRPEYESRWGRKTYATQLRLESLPPTGTEELLGVLLGEGAGLEPLKRILRRRGNPFFLEETIRTLAETGALEGSRGAYRLTRPLESLQVPATVQAILAARIDRLAPDDKRLLQAASVVGKDVPLTILGAIAGEPEDTVQGGLARLQGAEFLYQRSLYPDEEYTFTHALTQEVTYGTLLQERRRALHAAVVEAIERLYPDRLAEHVDRLAYHALRGGVWDRAVGFSRQAGQKAVGQSAYREAIAHFDQALEALNHLPEDRSALEQGIDLRLDLRNALAPLHELEQINDRLREAAVLARRLDDQRRLGFVYAYMATLSWMTGDVDHATDWGRRGLAQAEATGDLVLGLNARFRLGLACHFVGDYPGALELLGRNVTILEERGANHERFGETGLLSVLSRIWVVYCLGEYGRFAEGLARAEEAVRIATEADHLFSVAGAMVAMGFIHLRRGDHAAAVAALARGLDLSESADLPLWWPTLAALLGLSRARAGQVGEALPLLEEAGRRADAVRHMTSYGLWIAYLAEARLLSGDPAGAGEATRRAIAFSRERGARGQLAWALAVAGQIASHHQPPEIDEARDHYGEALVLATELGMRPLVAHCHLGLGKLYRRTGKRERAQEHLATAATMYREMGMTYWLEQADPR